MALCLAKTLHVRRINDLGDRCKARIPLRFSDDCAPSISARLGFEISERTVSRWVKRATRNPDPARRWLAFLQNHREAIAAMDFFTVPTLTFGVLYCFFVIGHDRRKILHCNVTCQPNALWIVLQLREAWCATLLIEHLV
jgi:hypothetical protein